MEEGGAGQGSTPGRRRADNGSGMHLPAEVEDQIGRLRERLLDLSERGVAYVRERPLTSLVVAAGAGYLLGRMFSR